MLKRFNFFDTELVEDEQVEQGAPHLFFQSLSITSCSAGHNHLVFGDDRGGITLVNRSFQPRRYSGHDIRVNHVHQLSTKDVLVSVGDARDHRPLVQQKLSKEVSHVARVRLQQTPNASYVDRGSTPEQGTTTAELPRDPQGGDASNPVLTSTPVVKIWKQDRLDADGFPQCVRTIELSQNGLPEKDRPPWPLDQWPAVTSVDVLEDLSQLALGLSNGFTFLMKGDLLRDRGCACYTLAPPSYVAPSVSPSQPASLANAALSAYQAGGFQSSSSSSGGNEPHIRFRPTYLPVTGVAFQIRDEPNLQKTTASSPSTRRVIWLWVASGKGNNGGVRAYHTAAERVGGWVSMGEKAGKSIHAGPLLDVEGCAPNCCCLTDKRESTTTYVHDEGQDQSGADAMIRNAFFVVGKDDHVKYFTPEDPGACYVIAGVKRYLKSFNNYLVVVSEVSKLTDASAAAQKQQEIHIYDFKNKLIAFSHRLTPADGQVIHVVNHWGIIFVVTSTHRVFKVVEKDIQTKLKDLYKRNLFPTAISLAQTSKCDKNTILDMYRMYGDYLYNKSNFEDAVAQYVRTIGFVEPSYVIRKFLDAQRIANLTVYLEALHMDASVRASRDVTTLLLNCYTKQNNEKKLTEFVRNEAISFDVDAAIAVLQKAGYFEEALFLAEKHDATSWYFKIQVLDLRNLNDALRHVEKLDYDDAQATMSEYGPTFMGHDPDNTTNVFVKLYGADWNGEPVAHLCEAPDFFINSFVNHPKQFKYFLGEILAQPHVLSDTQIWNTYLELSLMALASRRTQGSGGSGNEPCEEEKNVMATLRDPSANYDPNHALILVNAHGFTRGQLFLYEKLHMYNLLVQHYMDIGDQYSVILKCKMYGDQDPNLWVQVLSYFVSKGGNDHEEEIAQILNHIEKSNVIPPLLVVQILSSNPSLSLSVALPFLENQLRSTQELIEEDEKEIAQLQDDTTKMKQRIKSLTTEPQVYKATKCDLTGAPLELPTVHFLSGNSYNLSSLPESSVDDNRLEDPKCVREQRSVFEIIQGLNRRNEEGIDEEFLNEMDLSEDGFKTVAEYFGKCLFNLT